MELSKFLRKRTKAKENAEEKFDYIKYGLIILKAAVFAVLLTIVLFLLSALILLVSGVDDEIVPIIVQVVRIISIGFAGIICGRNAPRMGWLAGIIAGLAYVILTIVIGLLFYDSFSFDKILLIDVVTGGAAGFIAGVIGINTKKK